MKTALIKRLDELERVIKEKKDTALFISGKNTRVRVDMGSRRGMEVTFSSVREMRLWIEKQIDNHAGGVIDYRVDNVCDLFADPGAVRESLGSILERPVIIRDYEARLVNGMIIYLEKSGAESHPQAFSLERFPAGIRLAKLKPGAPANLALWCIAGLIARIFNNLAFFERWEGDNLTGDDTLMLLCLLELFAWEYQGDPGGFLPAFADIFLQETGITMLQEHPEGRKSFIMRETNKTSL